MRETYMQAESDNQRERRKGKRKGDREGVNLTIFSKAASDHITTAVRQISPFS